jgi:hypothetical protein
MSLPADAPLFADVRWCWVPDVARGTPGMYLFRRAFEVTEAHAMLRFGISSDCRHNLFLDGELLGRGPCRSDLRHYRYEVHERPLAPGRHVLAVEVAVFPTTLPEGGNTVPEMHVGGGLVVGGGVTNADGTPLDSLSTGAADGGGWRCHVDPSRSFCWPLKAADAFHAIPPTEECQVAQAPSGWQDAAFNDAAWIPPCPVSPAIFQGRLANPYSAWWLAPREIPPMEELPQGVARILKTAGAVSVAEAERCLVRGAGDLAIPAGASASITLDLGHLATVFVEATVVGDTGSRLDLTYAEAMWRDGRKGMRSDPAGEVVGYGDRIHPSPHRHAFATFWFRTARFIRLDLVGGDNGMVLHGLRLTAAMYPFSLKAAFDDGSDTTRWVWETAWRTARLCAHEHYEDCPYYEQLQYVGDTRIQALVSYALTGDGRLGRQALRQFDASRLPEGITQSRYPSSWPQVIPGFSLYWVMMIADHHRYFADAALVRELLPGIMAVLDWFERLRRADGLLDHPNYWNFIDWLPEWDVTFPWGWGSGTPVRGQDRPDAIHALQYAQACRLAAGLCQILGEDRLAKNLTAHHRRTVAAVNRHCYDRARKLYLDVPGEAYTSQHVNAWAILADALPARRQAALARRLADAPGLSQASLYFTFYLFRAWEKAGAYDLFWRQLGKWTALRDADLSTFPEIPDAVATRSDCHAWSASPLHEYIACVLGVQPGTPGFGEVLIQPHFGPLRQASGQAPVGDAMAEVAWTREEDGTTTLKVAFDRPKDLRIAWPDGSGTTAPGHRQGSFHWTPAAP